MMLAEVYISLHDRIKGNLQKQVNTVYFLYRCQNIYQILPVFEGQ